MMKTLAQERSSNVEIENDVEVYSQTLAVTLELTIALALSLGLSLVLARALALALALALARVSLIVSARNISTVIIMYRPDHICQDRFCRHRPTQKRGKRVSTLKPMVNQSTRLRTQRETR